MDSVAYAQRAVDLINAPLSGLEDLRSLLVARPWLAERLRSEDVPVLQELRARLAELADASAADDGARVVAGLNALLAVHPIRPTISGHDPGSWHLHVQDESAAVCETLCAESLFGLTMMVCEHGATRIGRCAATGCDNAFIDTSANRSRRFCSTRCSTRTNVAALRRRRQARLPADDPT